MISKSIDRLQYLCNTIPELLLAIPERDFSLKPFPNKWSKKEILGHLIDSAANNHQRFIRVQFEEIPFIKYDQDNWNSSSRYQKMTQEHVIAFWKMYNQHLIEVAKRIPSELLTRECNSGNENNVTLQWLINDYVTHQEHHLRQIVDY